MLSINARGLPAPMPVSLARRELKAQNPHFIVEVQGEEAVEHLSRLAQSHGYTASCTERQGFLEVTFLKDEPEPLPSVSDDELKTALFISRDGVGEGDAGLSSSLMDMLLFTVSERADPPKYVLLLNGGVKLACQGGQTAQSLKALSEKGSVIYVCGTCLSAYGLKDSLKVGQVSTMFEILNCMEACEKVISL